MFLTDWDKLSEGEKFKETFRSLVKRPGAEDLLKGLEKIGFFEAPASTKYHGAYPGGLVEHSNNVFRELTWLNAEEARKGRKAYSAEHIAVAALLHDVCKAQQYRLERVPTGQQYVFCGDAGTWEHMTQQRGRICGSWTEHSNNASWQQCCIWRI